MALKTEISEYYKLICKSGPRMYVKDTNNKLSEEITNINSTFDKSTGSTNEACQYLNDCANDIIKGRSCSSDLSVGKESAPLIVSLKRLADSAFNSDIKSCDIHIEEKLQKNMCKIEDNFHKLEDFRKSTNKSIQNLEYFIKQMKKQYPHEKNLSTASEISSFLDKDVITSSPIGKI